MVSHHKLINWDVNSNFLFNFSQELHQLKQALKEDYEANEEEMPVNLMKPIKGKRKKKKVKNDLSKQTCEMIEVKTLFQTRNIVRDSVGDGSSAEP